MIQLLSRTSFLARLWPSVGSRITALLALLPVLVTTLLQLGFVFFVPYFKLLHSSNIIEQTQFHATQQVFQVQYSLERQDTANRICWFSTLVQPIERALAVQLDRRGNCKGIVSTDFLDEFSIPWGTGISHYDKVEWPFLGAVTLQSHFNWHRK